MGNRSHVSAKILHAAWRPATAKYVRAKQTNEHYNEKGPQSDRSEECQMTGGSASLVLGDSLSFTPRCPRLAVSF